VSAVRDFDNSRQSNGFDRIAKDLPADLQAAYYRELVYCRSLPENDEILRVIRILQILTYLIQRAPETVIKEREKIEAGCQRLEEALDHAIGSTESYHAELDSRLTQLPQQIAAGIQPKAIASAVFESLRQEFVRSGIPQMSQPLQAVSADLKKTAGDLQNAASSVQQGGEHVVDGMRQAEQAFVRKSQHLTEKYSRLQYAICGLVIFLSIMFGMWLQGELDMRVLADRPTAANVEQAHPATPPPQLKKSR